MQQSGGYWEIVLNALNKRLHLVSRVMAKKNCISEVAQGHEHARLKPVRRPARVRDVGHSSAAGLGAGSPKALLPKKERAPRGGPGVHMPKRPGGGVEQPHAGSVLLVVSAGREGGVFPKSTKT